VLYGVLLNMEELKKWQAKENDTPKDLPRMTEKENQHNDAALALCQAASTTLEKDIIVLVNNCKYLYLAGDVDAPRPITDILNMLEKSIRNKGITIKMTPRISKKS
jgi:hypothetical protein